MKEREELVHDLIVIWYALTNYHLSTILFPNGISDTSISLKCCSPKGINMTVRQSRQPKIKWLSAAKKPPQNIQIILSSSERQPVELSELTASKPKGLNTKNPSLKHCNPNGIPITVMQSTSPPTK